MQGRWILVMGSVLALLAVPAAQAESYYYESVTTTSQGGKGQQDRVRGWVDGAKVRIEFPEGGQGGRVQQGGYMLTTNAGETIYMVDPKEKTYFEFDLAQLMSMVEATGGIVDIQFRDVSAEKLEESPGGAVLGRNTTKYKVRSQFTMEMNIMGMQRVTNVDSTQDMWTTRDVGGEAWTMWFKMLPSGGDANAFVQWAEDEGMTNVFPLKTSAVTTMTNRKGKTQTTNSEMEVTVLRVEPIEATVFEIPADYTKAEIIPPEFGGSEEAEAGGPMKRFKGMFGKKKKDGGR